MPIVLKPSADQSVNVNLVTLIHWNRTPVKTALNQKEMIPVKIILFMIVIKLQNALVNNLDIFNADVLKVL
jgi:hypothetical protein